MGDQRTLQKRFSFITLPHPEERLNSPVSLTMIRERLYWNSETGLKGVLRNFEETKRRGGNILLRFWSKKL